MSQKFAPTKEKQGENHTGRQAMRFHADYLIKNNLCKREAMSDEQVDFFLNSINTDQRSDFGVVKMSKFNVDQLVGVKEFHVNEWQKYRKSKEKMTLVRYAALKNRDAICISLMRAGANITKTWTSNCQIREDGLFLIENVLKKFPKNYVVWILKEIIESKKRAFDFLQRHAATNFFKRNSNAKYRCRCCKWCTLISDGDFCMLKCCKDNENCIFCEPCLWNAWLERVEEFGIGDYRTFELRCPNCQKSPDPLATEEAVLARHSGWEDRAANDSQNSLNRFLKLPEKYEKGRKECHEVLARRSACSFSEISRCNLGSTREQRTANLFQCVVDGNLARLESLFNAGVDINSKNEYGQNCVFLALLNSQFHLLKVLKAFGCRFDEVSNCGTKIAEIAGRAICQMKTNFSTQEKEKFKTDLDWCGVDVKRKYIRIEHPLSEKFVDLDNAKVKVLIKHRTGHPGAGACQIDGAFSVEFLRAINNMRRQLPLIPPVRDERNSRRLFYDSLETVSQVITGAIKSFRKTGVDPFGECYLFPQMRFLEYRGSGNTLNVEKEKSKVNYVDKKSKVAAGKSSSNVAKQVPLNLLNLAQKLESTSEGQTDSSSCSSADRSETASSSACEKSIGKSAENPTEFVPEKVEKVLEHKITNDDSNIFSCDALLNNAVDLESMFFPEALPSVKRQIKWARFQKKKWVAFQKQKFGDDYDESQWKASKVGRKFLGKLTEFVSDLRQDSNAKNGQQVEAGKVETGIGQEEIMVVNQNDSMVENMRETENQCQVIIKNESLKVEKDQILKLNAIQLSTEQTADTIDPQEADQMTAEKHVTINIDSKKNLLIKEKQHIKNETIDLNVNSKTNNKPWCPPHTDISRTDKNNTSTHTFILYLKDVNDGGGGTVLLEKLPKPNSNEGMEVKCKITPKKGRLIFYPHATPHSGLPIIDDDKILIRGEMYIGPAKEEDDGFLNFKRSDHTFEKQCVTKASTSAEYSGTAHWNKAKKKKWRLKNPDSFGILIQKRENSNNQNVFEESDDGLSQPDLERAGSREVVLSPRSTKIKFADDVEEISPTNNRKK